MSALGFALGLIWDIAAWFLIVSTFAAPFVALVVKCKAIGKRKFADEPTARVRQLHPTADHRWDA